MPMRLPLSSAGPARRSVARSGASSADFRRCEAVHARLHEFVDDELDPRIVEERQVRAAIAAHLAGCTRCARLESQRRAMRAAVAAVGARTARIAHLVAHRMTRELSPGIASRAPLRLAHRIATAG